MAYDTITQEEPGLQMPVIFWGIFVGGVKMIFVQ